MLKLVIIMTMLNSFLSFSTYPVYLDYFNLVGHTEDISECIAVIELEERGDDVNKSEFILSKDDFICAKELTNNFTENKFAYTIIPRRKIGENSGVQLSIHVQIEINQDVYQIKQVYIYKVLMSSGVSSYRLAEEKSEVFLKENEYSTYDIAYDYSGVLVSDNHWVVNGLKLFYPPKNFSSSGIIKIR